MGWQLNTFGPGLIDVALFVRCMFKKRNSAQTYRSVYLETKWGSFPVQQAPIASSMVS